MLHGVPGRKSSGLQATRKNRGESIRFQLTGKNLYHCPSGRKTKRETIPKNSGTGCRLGNRGLNSILPAGRGLQNERSIAPFKGKHPGQGELVGAKQRSGEAEGKNLRRRTAGAAKTIHHKCDAAHRGKTHPPTLSPAKGPRKRS